MHSSVADITMEYFVVEIICFSEKIILERLQLLPIIRNA